MERSTEAPARVPASGSLPSFFSTHPCFSGIFLIECAFVKEETILETATTSGASEGPSVEVSQVSDDLKGSFRAIPRLRWRLDEDKSPIGYANRVLMVRDELYVASSSLLGLYLERGTERAFNSAVKMIRARVRVEREILGDQDGILFFPWEDVFKLPWFFKKDVPVGNTAALRRYWEGRKRVDFGSL